MTPNVYYIYMRLWWWWKRRRDYGDSSGACLNCWLLNFVLVLVSRRFSRRWSLVVVLVVDRWWWWCCRRRFFSSPSLSIICAVGLRLLLWFVVWNTERDKDTAKKKEKEIKNCRKKEKKVCAVIPQRVIVKERARWASFLSYTIIHIWKYSCFFLFFCYLHQQGKKDR
jgi:hypothetical protein